ncbi:hypothetical protein [Microbacterium sp. A94]
MLEWIWEKTPDGTSRFVQRRRVPSADGRREVPVTNHREWVDVEPH